MLAWADVRNGYQHEVISHALATLERLGYESGAYDTFIRTDSQLITKRPITFKTGTGIATGEQFLAHNLNDFDAIFFFGVREIELTAEQRAQVVVDLQGAVVPVPGPADRVVAAFLAHLPYHCDLLRRSGFAIWLSHVRCLRWRSSASRSQCCGPFRLRTHVPSCYGRDPCGNVLRRPYFAA